jgi:hypothetical protein
MIEPVIVHITCCESVQYQAPCTRCETLTSRERDVLADIAWNRVFSSDRNERSDEQYGLV